MDVAQLGLPISEASEEQPAGLQFPASSVIGLSEPLPGETPGSLPAQSPFPANPAVSDLPPDMDIDGQEDDVAPTPNAFTLRPAAPSSPSQVEDAPALGPSFVSSDQTPRNALLDLYKLGKTPQEGLVIAGNHIGEFLAAIQDDLRIPAMFVVPANSRSRGRATQLGNHWVLEVPTRVRNGLAASPYPVPQSSSAPIPTTSAANAITVLNDEVDETASSGSGTSVSAPLANSRDSLANEALPRAAKTVQRSSGHATPIKWVCEACSYKNPVARTTCRGCGAPRAAATSGRRHFTRRPSRLGVHTLEDDGNDGAEIYIDDPPALDDSMAADSLVAIVPAEDPDLVIYEDELSVKAEEEPMRRRRGRRPRDSPEKPVLSLTKKTALEVEIKAAAEEIKLRRKNFHLADQYLSSISWPDRKRVVHAHLLSVIYERIGEIPTWQEIPAKLYEHRLRIVGWPAVSPYPGPDSSVTIYRRDALHYLCKAIWNDTLKLQAWRKDENSADYPPLLIDTDGNRYSYEVELKGKSALHASSQLPGSGARVVEPSHDESARDSDSDDETEEEETGGEVEVDQETEDEGKDEDYSPITRRTAGRRKSGGSDPSPGQSSNRSGARPFPTPSLRTITEKRYFTDAEMEKGKQELDERTSDFANSGTFMNNVEWNILRRMCRLHLSVYLNDNLGYTDFQDIPLRLREKRLRLTGWPAECDLPSGTHPANWKRDWVKMLLLAVWGKTLVLEDWADDEIPEDAALIIDTFRKKHYYNDSADALLPENAPRTRAKPNSQAEASSSTLTSTTTAVTLPPLSTKLLASIPAPSKPRPHGRYLAGKHYTWEPIVDPPPAERQSPTWDWDGPSTRRQTSRLLSNSPAQGSATLPASGGSRTTPSTGAGAAAPPTEQQDGPIGWTWLPSATTPPTQSLASPKRKGPFIFRPNVEREEVEGKGKGRERESPVGALGGGGKPFRLNPYKKPRMG